MQIAGNAKFQQTLRVLLLFGIAMFFIAPDVQICCSVLHQCNPANYTRFEFGKNLDKVLDDLVNHTSSSNGFYTSVSGQNPDRAYGLLQCTGDATEDECLSCSQYIISSARQQCGNATGGIFCHYKCFLRYENFTFFGRLDTVDQASVPNPMKAQDDPDGFSAAVKALFRNLSDEALRSPLRYSTGQTSFSSSFYQIFGFLQCWRDITSVDDCKTCLTIAIRLMLDTTDNGTKIGGWGGLGSCLARYDIFPFFNPAPPPPPLQLLSRPPIQHPPSPVTPKKSSNKRGLVLGVVSGLFVMLLLCLFAIRRKLKSAVLGKPTVAAKDTEVDSAIGQEQEIIYNLKNIKAVTRNFHDDNKLGEGGFGSVYKGTMPNGIQIAVKRLSVQSLQGKEQFLNEVKLVAKIQHRNLVNLLGCCAERSERLLVYEFLPNNSLDKILFSIDPHRSKELDWHRRLNIILGVARGLLYLHEDSQLPIIHRDIKASNILLDNKMEPKISDFGLARLFSRDESHLNTRVAGTLGYMAPEYALGGQLSIKVDVYSFGVVILEIICGRKNTNNRLSFEFQSLLEWVWRSYRGGNIVDVIDRSIIESFPNEEVSRCIHVGLLCTQADASLRPPMASVYAMLSNHYVSNLPDPTKPAYLSVTQTNVPLPTSTSTSPSTTSPASHHTHLVYSSINDTSVSNLGPR